MTIWEGFRHMLVDFSIVISIVYFMLKLIIETAIIDTNTFVLFQNNYIEAIMCLILIFSCISFGKRMAIFDADLIRRKCLAEMHKKEEKLIDYIQLARILTQDDVKNTISIYVDKLNKKYKISEATNGEE